MSFRGRCLELIEITEKTLRHKYTGTDDDTQRVMGKWTIIKRIVIDAIFLPGWPFWPIFERDGPIKG